MGARISRVYIDFQNRATIGNAVGDTWCPAWQGGPRFYASACDGSGIDGACHSNLFINRLDIAKNADGSLSLTGETVNPMNGDGDSRWDYGPWAGQPNWKANGLACIDDALYLFVSRHALDKPYMENGIEVTRQNAWDASLIRSEDGGKTWTRDMQRNMDTPMFPGPRFASPFFVSYGQNGAAPAVDRADEYIYAVANDGFWNNGGDMILGRVHRSRIGALDAKDWSFYTGGDGEIDGNWTADYHSDMVARIIRRPYRLSQAPITYISAIGRYLMLQWYYHPRYSFSQFGEKVYNGWGGMSYLDVYESPHPWGPFTLLADSSTEEKLGWYNPMIMDAFTTRLDDDTYQSYCIASGDFAPPQALYRINLIPLTIETLSSPLLPDKMSSSTHGGLSNWQTEHCANGCTRG